MRQMWPTDVLQVLPKDFEMTGAFSSQSSACLFELEANKFTNVISFIRLKLHLKRHHRAPVVIFQTTFYTGQPINTILDVRI